MRLALRIDARLGKPSVWVVGAALALAAYAALYEIRTYDTLFHLAAGRYVLSHGQLPDHDPFSFTYRGASWVNHSPAFQVLLAVLHRWGGFELLSVYQAVLACALCALALIGVRGQSDSRVMLAAVLVAVPYAAFREVLEARPHVLGFLCLAAVLCVVQAAEASGRARRLWWAVPLYAAWAASHGSHVLAFVVFAVGAACAGARGQRALCGGYLAVFALCVLTMRVIAPWAFTQGLAHAGSLFLESAVTEWKPLTAADVFGTGPGLVFACVWLLTLSGVVSSVRALRRGVLVPRAVTACTLILVVLAMLLSLTSRRMIALFLFGAAPLWLMFAVQALSGLARFVPVLARIRVATAASGVALIAVFVASYSQGQTFRSGLGLERDRFPVAAVDAMRESGRVRRVYNAYNFGGYLMFAGVPEQGVFVDGRAITLYPSEFLTEFQAAYGDPRVFERLATRYACDAVLLPVGSGVAGGLRAYLDAGSAWRLTHRDAVAALYERVSPLAAAR